MVAQCRRCIIIGSLLDGGQRYIVFPMPVWIEKPSLIPEQVGVVKTIGNGHPINVPFSCVVGTVALRFEHPWQQHGPILAFATISTARRNARQGVTTNLLGVIAGQQRSSRRPASGGVVELCEPQAIFCQRIEVGRCNFTSVAAKV